MDKNTVLATRLTRHRLSRPCEDSHDFLPLFRALQPVSTAAFAYPGSPPRLAHRTTFDSESLADELRGDRRIVKGRFLGGTIGYVTADDLALYAKVFRKPIERLTRVQQIVLDAVTRTGPLTPRQIKEETGLLNKQTMPVLHRLQKAFLVFEDQVETDWERGWYGFASEWPELDVASAPSPDEVGTVLERVIQVNMFLTFQQIKDWSGLPTRVLNAAIDLLGENGRISECEMEGLGGGWLSTADLNVEPRSPQRGVFVLDQADPLMRIHKSESKTAFQGLEILQYLLIDGELCGAVCGHWRIGPHDVEDIVVLKDEVSRNERREEILAAVSERYHPPNHQILKYDGRRV